MSVKTLQIDDADSAVNGLLARELDDAYHALLGDADNCELFQRVDTLEHAYRESLLPPWSIRWREIHSIPPGRGKAFRDLDRRSNVNALRRAVTAARRTLQRIKGSPSSTCRGRGRPTGGRGRARDLSAVSDPVNTFGPATCHRWRMNTGKKYPKLILPDDDIENDPMFAPAAPPTGEARIVDSDEYLDRIVTPDRPVPSDAPAEPRSIGALVAQYVWVASLKKFVREYNSLQFDIGQFRLALQSTVQLPVNRQGVVQGHTRHPEKV